MDPEVYDPCLHFQIDYILQGDDSASLHQTITYDTDIPPGVQDTGFQYTPFNPVSSQHHAQFQTQRPEPGPFFYNHQDQQFDYDNTPHQDFPIPQNLRVDSYITRSSESESGPIPTTMPLSINSALTLGSNSKSESRESRLGQGIPRRSLPLNDQNILRTDPLTIPSPRHQPHQRTLRTKSKSRSLP
jgi:hypothetical protein